VNVKELLKKYEKYSEAEIQVIRFSTFYMTKVLSLPKDSCVRVAVRCSQELRNICHTKPDKRQNAYRRSSSVIKPYKVCCGNHRRSM